MSYLLDRCAAAEGARDRAEAELAQARLHLMVVLSYAMVAPTNEGSCAARDQAVANARAFLGES